MPGLGLAVSVLLHALLGAGLAWVWWSNGTDLPEPAPITVEIVPGHPRRGLDPLPPSSAKLDRLPPIAGPEPMMPASAPPVPAVLTSALSTAPATSPMIVAPFRMSEVPLPALAAVTAPELSSLGSADPSGRGIPAAAATVPAAMPVPPAVASTPFVTSSQASPPTAIAPALEASVPLPPAPERALPAIVPPVLGSVSVPVVPATAVALVPVVMAALPTAGETAATIDLEEERRHLQARLPQLPCSHLQIAVRDDLTPVLRGRVGSAEELADLRGALDGLAALGKPELAVEILEPPFCQALDQLEVAMAGEMTPPAIGLNSPNLTFQDGDFVVVTIEVPADFGDGYLHVIFIDHADKVIHLLPNPFVRNTVVHGGERVQLGVDGKSRRAGLRDYQVTPPYGRGLVLALLSTVPLHEVGVREVETSADLMASLRAAAAGLQPASLRVAHIVLTTVAARR